MELLESLRVLPAIFSCLTLWPAWIVVRELVPSTSGRIVAFAIFGLRFVNYDWLIMGGGITRAPGYFFGLFALACFLQAKRTVSFRLLCIAAVMGALAVLSHPLMSSVMILSIICFVVGSAWKFSLKQTAAACALFLTIWLPWCFAMLLHHGMDPFLQAIATGQASASGLLMPFLMIASGSPVFEAPTVILLFLGILACFLRQNYRLLIWFLLLLEIPRLSFIHSTLPIAVLGGIGFQLLASLSIFAEASAKQTRRFDAVNVLVAIALGVLTALSALRTSALSKEILLESDVRTLQWIQENTEPLAKFFIITNHPSRHDFFAEWFPALSQRKSILTFEGKEWLSSGEVDEVYLVRQMLKEARANCAAELPDELTKRLRETDYILIDRETESERFTKGFEFVRRADRYAIYRRISRDPEGEV